MSWTEDNKTDPQGDWGQAAENNEIGIGQAAENNLIGWGLAHVLSWGHALTNLFGKLAAIDPDYQAVLDYATTQSIALPISGVQTIQNQLMIDRKAAGTWNKDDSFVCFSGTNSAFALIDWKRLSLYTAISAPTYVSATGFDGDGVAAEISTNFEPDVNGVNYTLNNAGIAYGLSSPSTDNNYIVGSNSIKDIRSRAITAPDNQLNSAFAQFSGSVSFNTVGNKYMDRVDATNVVCFGDATDTQSAASTNIQRTIVKLFRLGGQYTDAGMSWFRIGAGYTPAEKLANNTAINTYLNAL